MEPAGGDVKAIFIAALDREPGEERAAFLEVAYAGRDDLRRRVEALLAARERADEVLGHGSDSSPTGTATPSLPPGPEVDPNRADGPGEAADDATVGAR